VCYLALGTELCFRVKAREVRPYAPEQGLETAWSVVRCAIVSGEEPELDTTPPAPAPYVTAYPNSPNSVRLVSSIAHDASGVEYYFECYSGDCHDSDWQDEPNYTDVNLVAETQYCYRVKARDKSPNQNETGWSAAACATTPPSPDTTVPEPDPMQWDETIMDVNGYSVDGRPHEIWLGDDLIWDFYVTMRADPNTDDESGVEFYFECTTNSGFSSGWIQFAGPPYIYTVKVGQSGLQHRFRVKARDRSASHNETGWSPEFPAIVP
jgi:hypothetical protein